MGYASGLMMPLRTGRFPQGAPVPVDNGTKAWRVDFPAAMCVVIEYICFGVVDFT